MPEGGSLPARARAVHELVVTDPRAGLPEAVAVAARARAAGDAEALVIALRAAGWAARELYLHDDARTYLDEAVAVGRSAGCDDALARALLARAAVHHETGAPAAARRDLTAAARAAGPAAAAEVAFATGLADDVAGDLVAAARSYRRAVRAVPPEEPDLRVKALNNLGAVLVRTGAADEAEQVLDEALAAAEAVGPALAGRVAPTCALAALARGDASAALDLYDRAGRLLRSVDYPTEELHLDRAVTLLALRLLPEARAAVAAAVAGYGGHGGGSLMLADALVLAARVALADDRPGDALAAARRADELLARQRRPAWRAAARSAVLHARAQLEGDASVDVPSARHLARALAVAGDVDAAVDADLLVGAAAVVAGRPAAARAAYVRAERLAASGPVLTRVRGRVAAARRGALDGDRRAVLTACRRGLVLLDAHGAALASPELRAAARAHGAVLADLGTGAAGSGGRAEDLWRWLEAGQTTALLDAPRGGDDRVVGALGALRAEHRLLAGLGPDDAADRARAQVRVASLEQQVRRATWTSTSTSPARAPASTRAALRTLQADLGDGTALVQLGTVGGALVAVVVTGDRVRRHDLAASTVVDGLLARLHFGLRRLAGAGRHPARTRAAARDDLDGLASALVTPLLGRLQGCREVVVVAPAPLLAVPWAALPGLAGRSVVAAPSARLWRAASARVPGSDRAVLVAGPDLPGAAPEVDRLAARHPGATVLRGPAATVEAVLGAVPGAGLVHLAAHGTLRADSPGFSALHLADGPLTVHDLESAPATAHRWVLAACDLGSTGHLRGPELQGVVAALLRAGAAGVLAAAVAVPDAPTVEVMAAVHDALTTGATLPGALAAARSALDDPDPATWAALTALGCYGAC